MIQKTQRETTARQNITGDAVAHEPDANDTNMYVVSPHSHDRAGTAQLRTSGPERSSQMRLAISLC